MAMSQEQTLDSHADTTVLGKHCLVIMIRITANVSHFCPELQKSENYYRCYRL
jgi:hypothetical protein